MLKRIVMLCAFSSSIVLSSDVAASDESGGVIISAYLDSATSDKTILSNYITNDIRESLFRNIAKEVKNEIESTLSSQEIGFPVYLPKTQDESPYDGLHPDHRLTLAFSFDRSGLISVQATLNKTGFSEAIEDAKVLIISASALSIHESPENAAGQIARELVPAITHWIFDSIYKVRVMIHAFNAEDSGESNLFLKSGLANMVMTELTRSQAFIVYSDCPPKLRKDERNPPTFANYVISGSFFTYQNGIRVDIFCTNTASQRILLSQSVVLDTLSLHALSDRIAQISSRLKSAMLADFQQSQFTIAVVTSPPRRYFVGRRGLGNLRDVARIFRHNIVNKLRILVKPQGSLTNDFKTYIMEDTDLFDRFLDSAFAPGEMLNELSADYLVLVGIEDIGQGIRATSTLYSYVTDPPLIGELIHDGSKNKAKFADLLDETVLKVFNRLCELRVIPDTTACLQKSERKMIFSGQASSDEIDAYIDALGKDLKEVRVQDIRPNKGIGLRVGVSIHADERLFLGRKSTEYLELFYSIRLPDLRNFPPWLATELEVSVGLDYGEGTLLRKGTTVTNLMLSSRFIVTALQYSDLPLLFGLGVGLGIYGISYKYDANEAPYAGTRRLEDADVRALYSVSAKIEVPVSDWLRLQIIPRYVGQLGSDITRFEKEPFDNTVASPPRGRLTGWNIIGGFRIVIR